MVLDRGNNNFICGVDSKWIKTPSNLPLSLNFNFKENLYLIKTNFIRFSTYSYRFNKRVLYCHI